VSYFRILKIYKSYNLQYFWNWKYTFIFIFQLYSTLKYTFNVKYIDPYPCVIFIVYLLFY
jgi:hypothetical protein